MKFLRTLFCALFALWANHLAFGQTLAPAGTVLNATHNYTWNRMSVPNVYSGQIVPLVQYQFTVNTTGAYTITMNTTGFKGAINLYQGSFLYSVPVANLWTAGAVAGAAGTLTYSVPGLPAGSIFVVVFSAVNTGEGGTFSASISGPAAVSVAAGSANVSIQEQPISQTISSGQTATLAVYATGTLPHTWQWYGGASGNTANPVAGATSSSFVAPPQVVASTSYWCKVTGPSNSQNSAAATVTVTGNVNADYSGSLLAGGCTLAGGGLYNVQRFRIQTAGNYAFTITSGFTLTTYQGSFDPLQPIANKWGYLNGFYAVGEYDLVISKASAGNFSGQIGGGPAIVGLISAAPPAITSGPFDTTVMSGTAATFRVATTCGTPFTLQWYRGNAGDTTSPVAGATGSTLTTGNLTAETKYWVKMSFAGGSANSGTATAFVVTGPVTDAQALTSCDRTFNHPNTTTTLSGQNGFYKTFVFRPSVDGSYTFTPTYTGFSGRLALYQGGFLPGSPLVNLFGVVNGTGALTSSLLTGGQYVLVVTSANAGEVGTYSVTVSGPALVTKYPAPTVTSLTTAVNVFRGEAATLSVVSPTPGVSYQWYLGTTCPTKVAINGATGSSYTTGTFNDNSANSYWVELTSPGGYLLSQPATVKVAPKGVNDTGTIAVNGTLTVAAPGVLGNDTKADSKTITAINFTVPSHGTVTGNANGSYTYKPTPGYIGTDGFTYQTTDGTFTSAPSTVLITVTGLPQTITFPPLTRHKLGEPTFTLNASSSSGLGIVYASANPNIATIAGNVVTIVGLGTNTITASQPGAGDYAAATPVSQTLIVEVDPTAFTTRAYYRLGDTDPNAAPGFMTMTYPTVGTEALLATGAPFYAADVAPAATAHTGSGLSANFFSGGPFITGAQLSFDTDNFGLEAWVKPTANTGNHCIAFNGNTGGNGYGLYQFGANFAALYGGKTGVGTSPVVLNTWVHLAIVCSKGVSTFYVNGVPAGSAAVTPHIPLGSFAIAAPPQNTGVERFAGYIDEVRFFTFASGNFDPRELLLTAAPQTITFGSLTGKRVGDPDFALTATASSGLAVTYTSSNPAVATVVGNTVSIKGAGTTTITARQAGHGDIVPAKEISQNLVVSAPVAVAANITGILQADGSFQLTFANTAGATFRVFGTSDVGAPFETWTLLGPAVEGPAGVFKYTDNQAPTIQSRFYRVRSP